MSEPESEALRSEISEQHTEHLDTLTDLEIVKANRDALAERVKVLEQLITDATYMLSKARIWNGMGWHYNPLHPIYYAPMRERLSNEADNIYAARAALEKT